MSDVYAADPFAKYLTPDTSAAPPIAPARDYASSAINAESGGKVTARNPNSSAAGPGQFIDSTWMDMVNKYRPELAAGKTKDQILSLRTDPNYAGLSKALTNAYGAENAVTLSNAGLEANPGNTYLAHFAGPQGAIDVLKANPNTPVSQILSPAAIKANPQIANMTAAQLQQWAGGKIGQPEGYYGGTLHVTVPPSQQEADPFAKYTGNNGGQSGERYQTWPERVARGLYESAKDFASLPHDVMQEANAPQQQAISDSDVSTLNVPRSLNFAGMTSGVMRQPGGQSIPTAGPSPIATAAVTPTASLVSAAAQRLGVDLPRAVGSDSAATQWAGKIVSNIPFAGGPLRKASEKAIGQLGTAAETATQSLGSGNIPSAGSIMRDGLTNYIQGTSRGRVSALYDKIDGMVDNATLTKPSKTQEILSTISGEKKLAGLPDGSSIDLVNSALTKNPDGLTYQGIKTLRSRIGEMLNTGILPADMSGAELKRIYGGLTSDLKEAVKNSGGDTASRAFERANNYARLAAQRNERIASVLGAKNDEGIFDRLQSLAGSTSRADIDLLRKARKSVDPTSWDEFSSGVISKMGRDAEGNFSPDRFVTAYGKVTPAAKSVLFKSTGKPEVAQALDDIAAVSSRFKSLNKYANPSGTGQTVAGFAELQGMWAAPMTTLSAIVSGHVLARILARPQTVKATAEWAKTYEAAATKPAWMNRQAFQRASKVLATTIGNEFGKPELIPALIGKLSGAVPATAEQQQQQ